MSTEHWGYTDDEWYRLIRLFDELPATFYADVDPKFWENDALEVAQIIEDKQRRDAGIPET